MRATNLRRMFQPELDFEKSELPFSRVEEGLVALRDRAPLLHNRFDAELLRAMRLENNHRTVVCYGWLGLSAFSIVSVLVLVVLSGTHIITLPERVILALIAGTVANGISMFATIIRSLFPKK